MIFKGFTRIGGTIAVRFYDETNEILNQYFFQFSFKNPFWYPHKEYIFNNGSWSIGWLFFYIGNIIAR